MRQLSNKKILERLLRRLGFRPKVFCIGFQKTGTSTMGVALETLGFKVLGTDSSTAEKLKTKDGRDSIVQRLKSFDACQDNPWPLLFKELHEKYPRAKFILTVRNEDLWVKSFQKYFEHRFGAMERYIYDCSGPFESTDTYVKVYNQHNDDVQTYFSTQPEKLLIMNIEEGDGWEQLCAFLKKPIPLEPFPHENKNARKK